MEDARRNAPAIVTDLCTLFVLDFVPFSHLVQS